MALAMAGAADSLQGLLREPGGLRQDGRHLAELQEGAGDGWERKWERKSAQGQPRSHLPRSFPSGQGPEEGLIQ